MVYNLPEISPGGILRLGRPTIVGIFNGSITQWDDHSITSMNPTLTVRTIHDTLMSLQLPNATIRIVVRSDSSGSSYTFASALKSFDPTINVSISTMPNWPAVSIRSKGSAGVSKNVFVIPYTISYLDVQQAAQDSLPFAMLYNKNGSLVQPDLESVKVLA